MADVERALVHSAILHGRVHDLVARGITPNLFSEPGQEAAAVLEFSIAYMRSYTQSPSLSTIQRQFKTWHGESSHEPFDALVDEFLDTVRMRYFQGAVLQLSKAVDDRANWRKLDEIILDAARDVAAAVPTGSVSRLSDDFERKIIEYEDEKNRGVRPGIELRIPIIDEVTQGIRPGWLVTTAGYSGMGKTTLAQIGLLSAFEQDHLALMCSLEMSSDEVLDRFHTMIMHFRHRDLVNRSLSDVDMQRWRDVSRIYSKAAGEIIVVDRLGGCTIDRIYAEISRYKPAIVAVDYVQRMRGTRHSMARWEGLEEITNDLKTIAMDTDTAILMVSQDGRSSADEGSTRTNMGGSVSVYQAADVYLGLQQDEAMRAQQRMRVRMLKFRHGPCAEVDMSWKPSTMEFGKYEDAQSFTKQAVAT
jgi:replicative DNA helicase